VAAKFEIQSPNAPSSAQGKSAWVRPAVQRLEAGAAEFGASTVPDFGDSKS
jgi:hypothetical protein